jgi:hypothetical protein
MMRGEEHQRVASTLMHLRQLEESAFAFSVLSKTHTKRGLAYWLNRRVPKERTCAFDLLNSEVMKLI